MQLNLLNPSAEDSGYRTTLPSASHWSLIVRRGMQMRMANLSDQTNVGMLFYNPYLLSEKYNAPDTLKCQHTFKLTQGHCLYSDMGRIFCSIVKDEFGWHDTVSGNSHASHVEKRWGKRDYQSHSNNWLQNGYDSFLVELAKYELNRRYMAANVNWFSEVSADSDGKMQLSRQAEAGTRVELRFEMDTLVVLHTCPHPLTQSESYPVSGLELSLFKADPVQQDDACLNLCPENQRGFSNNALYHLGI
tara:strand:- start:3428 stop:4168 length:741 start_codon:yes stop_codon:yes gene_type:complete